MTTYGSIPGVRITTSTGRISGVTIGRAQYLLLAGIGDPETAEVEPNDPVGIDSNRDADEKFGEDSDLADAYRRAIANGVNPQFIRGVRAEPTNHEPETFIEESGTLAETPIVADSEKIVATNSEDEELEVVLDYRDPVELPEDGKVHINPYTGEFESSEADIDISYYSADWETAIDSYKDELVEGEFGVISPLTSAAADVGLSLQNTITEMRKDLKLVVGVMSAEYNDTYEGSPWVNAGEFESTFSDDTLWLVTPTEVEGADSSDRGVGALSAVAGLFAGNATTEPVYDSTIDGVGGLEQRITRSDVSYLRDEYIVPLRDSGTIRIEDNHSSYDQDTDGGWERDFFRRRIVDLTMATMYLIARRQIGGILDSDTVDDVEDAVNVELSDLVEDGLLEPDQQEVSVYRADDRTIGMDLTITPLGVAKGAEIDLEINA